MKTAKEMFDNVMEKKTAQIAKAKARNALIWKVGAGASCLALVCVLALGLQKEPAPTWDKTQMAARPVVTQQTVAPTESVKPQPKPSEEVAVPQQTEPATVKPTAAPTAKPTVKPTVNIVKPVVRPTLKPVQPTAATVPQPTQAAGHYMIMLDVNPSIELEVGEGDKITQATFGNKDGEKILSEAALSGMNVAEGVGVLVKEMVEQGYISPEANSVLVSVAGAEKEKADTVKAELTEKISDALSEKNVEGAIIMQELSAEEATKDTAVDGISAGKAKLVEQIIAQNSVHTYEELAKMSIHQLNLLRMEYYVNSESIQTSGSPSTLAYIGKDEAIRIAQAAAQVTGDAEAELTCKAGVMVYIVEFENDTHEYRYQINAVTGEILKAEESELGKNDFFQGDTPIATVGEKAALAAALQHAGVENGKLIRCKCKSDWVDGKVIYDIYFTDGLTNGSYVINARTGEILKYTKSQEPRDRSVKVPVIGEAQAKAIAMAKDGLVDGNISKYEMQLKQKGESYVYEMMFICNGVRYTAEIAAADGEVLNFTREVLAETGRAPAEGEKNPSAEADKNDKPAEELTKPVPEEESNKPAEGDRPSTEEGDRPSTEEGNRPSAEEGDRPSTEEGDRPSAEEGNRPSAEDGDRPSTEEGNRPPAEEGNRPSTEEGDRPSAEEGDRPSAEG